jgi:hypothetical protein
MTYGWSTLKRYDVSERVRICIKYKQFDRISELTEERRIEVVNKQIGQNQSTENRYVARSIRLLIDRYGIRPRYEHGDSIPVEIALDGRPSIAVYLCGALDYDIDEVAEKMDVTAETIEKYVMRFEEPPYWSSEPDYEARFEVD